MKKLSDRFMFYSGVIASVNPAATQDLKHIMNLLEAEEKGLLLKLPFPLGTKRLYWIDMSEEDKEVYQLDATNLNIQKTDISDTIIYTIDDYDFVKSDFGKTVFLTKEEAEAKLKELENE